jgi:hypothetical protein
MEPKKITKKQEAENEKQEAIKDLRKALKGLKVGKNSRHKRIQTILRHVSQSGMSRDISVIINGENMDWQVSKVTGNPRSKHIGVKVGGCGMDMGFALIDSMFWAVMPEIMRAPGHGWQEAYRQEWL